MRFRALLVAALLSALPRVGQAYWGSTNDIVLGTAQTLEQGEVLIGVLMPAAYGVTDSVMVTIHPVNWALLTPNAGLRWRVLDTEVARLAITAEAAGTIRSDSRDAIVPDIDRPVGHVTGMFNGTFDVGGGVLLSALVGYQRDFDPNDNDFIWSASAHWLITEADMLIAQGGFQYSLNNPAIKTPQVSLTYVRAWEVLRFAIGVAWGNFPIAFIDREADKVFLRKVAVWPVLDVFWRF